MKAKKLLFQILAETSHDSTKFCEKVFEAAEAETEIQ